MRLPKKLRYWLEDCAVLRSQAGGDWRRYYHVHLRKTGGTSLNQMFLGLDGGDGAERYQRLALAERQRLVVGQRVFVGWNRKLIEKGAYFYAFSHIPFHELHLPAETLLLTCFRDPVARLFSHYRMLREYQRDGVNHPCMREEEPWLGTSFGDFLARVPREHALCQLFMYSRSFNVEEALENVAKIHHVLFTESFSEGVARLNSQCGLHLRPLHSKKSRYREVLDPGEQARAREMLEPEYHFLHELKKTLPLPHSVSPPNG